MHRALLILGLMAIVNPWIESLGADSAGANANSRPPVVPRMPMSAQASRGPVAMLPPVSRPPGSPAQPPAVMTPPRSAASPVPAYSGANGSAWSEKAASARRDPAAGNSPMEVQPLSTNVIQRRTQPGAVPTKADSGVRGSDVNLQRLVRYFGNASPVSTSTNAAPAFNPPLKETGPVKPRP